MYFYKSLNAYPLIKMVYYFHIFFILLLIVKIKSDCPQSSFARAQVYICAEKCIEQSIQRCVDSDNFIGDVTSVSFHNTQVSNFRRAIFNNMPRLESIHATRTGIQRIYAGSFHNTPNLQKIDLTFNFIEEIPWGVFNNMKFKQIVLSWNNISFIEEEAFSNLPYLETLRLTRNKLTVYDKGWLKSSTSLEYLDLSYNKISELWFGSFDIFPNLTVLDLSFNEIFKIGGGSFENIKVLEHLDLTSNKLTALSVNIFPDQLIIKEFKIALNKLSFLSEKVLESGSVQAIGLKPNPWQCPCLDRILNWANKNKVTILDPRMDYRINLNPDLPVCAFRETNPDVCVLGYDEEFLSTQDEYFKEVTYAKAVSEKSTSKPPNFDVIVLNNPFANLSLSPLS